MQDARGDQCDKCGRLMNPTELLNPRCKLTGTVPVLRSTSHYFLDLPGLTPPLQRYITQASQQGGWSANCVQVPPTPADLHVCGVSCPSACAPLGKNSCPHVCLAASPPLLPCFPAGGAIGKDPCGARPKLDHTLQQGLRFS